MHRPAQFRRTGKVGAKRKLVSGSKQPETLLQDVSRTPGYHLLNEIETVYAKFCILVQFGQKMVCNAVHNYAFLNTLSMGTAFPRVPPSKWTPAQRVRDQPCRLSVHITVMWQSCILTKKPAWKRCEIWKIRSRRHLEGLRGGVYGPPRIFDTNFSL